MRFVSILAVLAFLLLSACSSAYNLTDRNGNTFVIESLETQGNLEYRAGDAVRELVVTDIVSLSVPSAEPRIFDGRVFYPATLALEDSIAVPAQGFVSVEGTLTAKSAGSKFSIQMSNVKELSRREKE